MLFSELQKAGQLHAAPPVRVGETVNAPSTLGTGLQRTPVSFTADVNEDGLKTLLLFPEVAGSLTVSDALSQSDIKTLLSLSEGDNPDAIIGLQNFLATDLLQYSMDPSTYDDQLLRSFSSSSFEQSFRTVMAASAVTDAGRLFHGAFGRDLQLQKLWPLRFLMPGAVTITQNGGVYHVQISMDAYSRLNP